MNLTSLNHIRWPSLVYLAKAALAKDLKEGEV